MEVDKDYPIQGPPTQFSEIYDRFFGKITDDMYAEWTKEETEADLLNILLDAIPGFEFPRFPLYDYNTEVGQFTAHLTSEEINILALLMLNVWVQRQMTSIENTRQKYTGSNLALFSRNRD